MAYFSISGPSQSTPKNGDGSLTIINPKNWKGRNDKTETLTINYRLGTTGVYSQATLPLIQKGTAIFNPNGDYYEKGVTSYLDSKITSITNNSSVTLTFTLNHDINKTIFVVSNGTMSRSLFSVGSGVDMVYLEKSSSGVYSLMDPESDLIKTLKTPASIGVDYEGTTFFNDMRPSAFTGNAVKSISVPDLKPVSGGFPLQGSTLVSNQVVPATSYSSWGTAATYDVSIKFNITGTNEESYDQGVILRVYTGVTLTSPIQASNFTNASYIDYLIILPKSGTAFIKILNENSSAIGNNIDLSNESSKTLKIDTNAYWYATIS